MDWSTIADWTTILFFLWFGLKMLVPSLDKGFYSILGGIIALVAAISIFIDRSP